MSHEDRSTVEKVSSGRLGSECKYAKEQMKRVTVTVHFTVQHQQQKEKCYFNVKSGQALCDSTKSNFFSVSVEQDRILL